MTALFDPGLQPERTGLAWQRTCLAFLVGSLVAMKVLPNILGAWSVLLGAAGAVEAAILLVAVRRRYLRNYQSLTSGPGGDVLLADGRLVAVLAVSAGAAGAVSLVLTVALHTG